MTTPADDPPSLYRFADLTLDAARRCVTRAGPADRAQGARFRFAALSRGVGAERRERRRSGREGLGPALREPRERGPARDAAAPEPRRRRESAPLHRDGSQQGLPAHPGRRDIAGGETAHARRGAALVPAAAASAARDRLHRNRELLARRPPTAAALAELRRRAAVREPEPRPRRRLLRDGHAGRDRDPADEDQRAQRGPGAAGCRCAGDRSRRSCATSTLRRCSAAACTTRRGACE